MLQTIDIRPLAVEPERAAALLDTTPDIIDSLVECGALDQVIVGLTPRILVASIEAYVFRQLDANALDRLADHVQRIAPRPWWARADEARPAEAAPAG